MGFVEQRNKNSDKNKNNFPFCHAGFIAVPLGFWTNIVLMLIVNEFQNINTTKNVDCCWNGRTFALASTRCGAGCATNAWPGSSPSLPHSRLRLHPQYRTVLSSARSVLSNWHLDHLSGLFPQLHVPQDAREARQAPCTPVGAWGVWRLLSKRQLWDMPIWRSNCGKIPHSCSTLSFCQRGWIALNGATDAS